MTMTAHMPRDVITSSTSANTMTAAQLAAKKRSAWLARTARFYEYVATAAPSHCHLRYQPSIGHASACIVPRTLCPFQLLSWAEAPCLGRGKSWSELSLLPGPAAALVQSQHITRP